jgi:ketosteroid isomerase-like protein
MPLPELRARVRYALRAASDVEQGQGRGLRTVAAGYWWAMSQENVEIVMGAFTAWNTGDMEAARRAWHPEATTRPRGWPEPTPRETWGADELTATDILDFGDRVVVKFTWHGTGHGPELMEMTGVYTIRDGAIIAGEFFWDHAEALEAAGLSE